MAILEGAIKASGPGQPQSQNRSKCLLSSSALFV